MNKKFPIVFQSVNGACEQRENDFSSYNSDEVTAVLKYIEILLNGSWNGKKVNFSDIGVISPYKAQCDLIKEKCDTNIAIGSAEQFQGMEKPIIIISTVRTDAGHLGFLKDYQVRKSSVTQMFYFFNLFFFYCSG